MVPALVFRVEGLGFKVFGGYTGLVGIMEEKTESIIMGYIGVIG